MACLSSYIVDFPCKGEWALGVRVKVYAEEIRIKFNNDKMSGIGGMNMKMKYWGLETKESGFTILFMTCKSWTNW